jgi:hypothetical protein
MNNRATTVLLILFFGGLLAYWWADRARVPTLAETQRLSGRVLPQLIDADARSIARVEIDGEGGPLKFRRRDDGRWQMVAPKDVPAASSQIEALVTGLKALRRIGDATTLTGLPEKYGLDKPKRTIRLYEKGLDKPKAVLEVGNIVQDRRYVRAEGQQGAEVVDATPLAPVEAGNEGWRERMMFQVAPFDIEALNVQGPNVSLKLRRAGGRWKIIEPIQGPADPMKVDGLVADLVNLQVVRDARGFVADDVSEFSPYGLDPAKLTIEIVPTAAKGPPQVVRIGEEPEGNPGRVFARRGEQREVVLVSSRAVMGLASDPMALRSSKVADIDGTRVTKVRLVLEGTTHELEKRGDTWEIVRPSPGPADSRVVQSLIVAAADLQSMEFLDPARVTDPELDKHWATLEIWEQAGDSGETKSLSLELGRIDQASKAVFARVAGDPRIAALPEALASALPRGELAFRERSITTLGQGRIDKVERIMGGKRVVIEANGPPADFMRWRMTGPVDAPADPENTARLVVLLGGMRAEDLVEAEAADLGKYGLDSPDLSVSWSSRPAPPRPGQATGGPASGKLLIGDKTKAKTTSRYAKLDGSRLVFTLEARALASLEAELHNRRVLSFPPERVGRIDLEGPESSSSWTHPPSPPGVPAKWVPVDATAKVAPGAADQIGALVGMLGRLLSVRYEQYDGPILSSAGLDPPRLTVRLHLEGESAPRVLRIGAAGSEPGTRLATKAVGANGPVFLMAEVPFLPWLGSTALPEEPFASDKP